MQLLTFTIALLIVTVSWAQPRVIAEWNFDTPGDNEGWKSANHITELRASDGALQGRMMDWDPFITGPEFEIPATPWQRVEVRIKTDQPGGGEIFWTNTKDSPYGGFSPGKETQFSIIGDNEWHEYTIYPFWHKEGKIILLRLDLARVGEADKGKRSFAVDYIRVVDLGKPDSVATTADWRFQTGLGGWEAAEGATVRIANRALEFTNGDSPGAFMLGGPMQFPLEDRLWLHVQMQADKGTAAYVKWVSSEFHNLHSAKFPIIADGRPHSYNIDMGGHSEWKGDVLLLGLQPTNASGATVSIQRIAITDEPQGGPEVQCSYVGLENAINRAAPRIPLVLNLENRGGQVASGARIRSLDLPAGVTVVAPDNWRDLPDLEPFVPTPHRIFVAADGPAKGDIRLALAGPGAPSEPITGDLVITESLNLAKADYVPEPQPVESDYEIGALYFPGFPTMEKWDPMRRTAPIRKPVLGWYDEGNPECVDWQIKWAVEHGMKFFLVDWYWSAGGRHLEHWVQAFQKARYKSYLKWAMMWANHNAPNTHSEEDQRKVTQFWIDNYFNTPEYYRIDDKPVVMIWSVGNMDRDMAGKGGAARLLEISREMAIQAGFKGIYFIAMKWPEASTDPAIIQDLADKGFDMTSIYHYMDHGGKAEDPQHFPFELCADASYDHWKSWHEANVIPFLPNLSTGWDSRPWHGDASTVIYGRTPELFRRICEDAKRFADETGVTRMTLAPLNEWGEGSYAEPCKEFGFEMYDAVRDIFCKKPAGGWPLNITPADVGLGPYDLPEALAPQHRTRWDFSENSQGWGPFMGVGTFETRDGAIHFKTVSNDPAVGVTLYKVSADKHPRIRIRMKIDAANAGEQAQLFWSTTTTDVNEAASAKFTLIGDGQWHDYVLPVGENGRWRGQLRTFRFDPCGHADAQVSIDEVELIAGE